MTTFIEMIYCIADRCSQKKLANNLIDHSELDDGLPTMDGIETLSDNITSLKDIFEMRKCAHIDASDYQFGLVQAWEIMAEIKGFTDIETRIFKNIDEVIKWGCAMLHPHHTWEVDT